MTFKPNHFTVWTEIPVSDLDRAIAFYNSVFKTELKTDNTGPNPIALFPTDDPNGIAGHLYPGNPASGGAGPTVHLACPDGLEETLDRVEKAGGTVVSEPIGIPAGRFAYCLDPDGNSIGAFAAA
ncbi:MAG: VOC family protein [Pseudomonadota bacterium]